MPIDARIPGQAVPSAGQNPLANLGQLLQLSGGIQAQQRDGQTRDLLSDPASYGDSTEGIAGPSVPQGGMTGADLRPDALRSLRGLNPELALGMEQFAQRQKQEARAMNTWEREAKAKEAGSQAKFWGQMADAGMKVWDDYQAALGGADPNDPTASFKARAAAQMSYEFQKQGLSDIAKTMGFELPEFFNLEDFKPEHFAQFRQAQHAEEQKLYLLQVPAEDPGGTPQTVAFAGSPAQVAAEAKRTGATAVGEVPKGLPAAGAGGGKPTATEHRSLAKDYDLGSAAFRETTRWLRTADTAQDNATGDQALTVAFARSLQPTGILSDADVRQAQSGDYPEILTALLTKITGGGAMDDRKRAALRRQTAMNLRNMLPDQQAREAQTLEFAGAHGYDTKALITPYAKSGAELIERMLSANPAPGRDNGGGGGGGGGGLQTGDLPRVLNDQDFAALTSGQAFIDPEGKRRVKP